MQNIDLMLWSIFVHVVQDVSFSCSCNPEGPIHPASLEAELYNKLFENYSRRVRPIKDHTQPINITLQMILTQVVDLVNTKSFVQVGPVDPKIWIIRIPG